MTRTWPSRSGSPRTGADRRRGLHAKGHALPLGEQAQPFGRFGRGASEVDILERPQAAAAFDPGEIEQFADHLDQVAGLHFDLADPVAHLGRQGVARLVRFTSQGLGEQADRGQGRTQLVGQVVDELGPDALQSSKLRDIGQEQRRPAARGATPAERDDGPIGTGASGLTDAVTAGDRVGRDDLGRGVEEDLDQAAPDEIALTATDHRMGGRIGAKDAQVGAHVQEALVHGVREGVTRLASLGRRSFESALLVRHGPAGVDGLGSRAEGDDRCDHGAGRCDQEQERPRIHAPSIAQAPLSRRSSRRP